MARHAPARPRAVLRRASALLLVLILLLGAAPAAPAGAEGPPRVLPQLLDEATARPEETFRVIVGRAGRGDDGAADRFVASRGHRKVKEVAGGGFVAEVAGRDVAALGHHPAVRWVTLDAAMAPTATVDSSKLATVYPQTVNATQLWNAGYAGKGVAVAVVDTGMPNAADFHGLNGDGSLSRITAAAKFNANAKDTGDNHGHGTLVGGIVAGNSWWRTKAAGQGKYIGVAPEANLVDVKVSDDAGQAYLSDVINGIEWVIANRQTYNIRVLNLSLVSTVAESAATSYLDAAVERAWLNGIFVVVAAGNLGPNTALYPPANDPFVVTVGASDPAGTTGRLDDGMAPWSSYGTTQDGYAKPDVVAPGRHVASVLAASNSVLGRSFSGRIVDTNYIWMSGTSTAAPVVAGVAALAFQKNPNLTNDALKWLLASTATKLGGATPLPGQGAGLVDAAAVLNYGGAPGVANNGLPISRQLTGPGGATTYTTSSWSSSSWSTSSWSTSSWTTSSWTTTSWTSTTPTLAPWTYVGVE